MFFTVAGGGQAPGGSRGQGVERGGQKEGQGWSYDTTIQGRNKRWFRPSTTSTWVLDDYCRSSVPDLPCRMPFGTTVQHAMGQYISALPGRQMLCWLQFFKSGSTQGFGAGRCAMLLSKKRTEVKKDKDKTGISTPSSRYTENRELNWDPWRTL